MFRREAGVASSSGRKIAKSGRRRHLAAMRGRVDRLLGRTVPENVGRSSEAGAVRLAGGVQRIRRIYPKKRPELSSSGHARSSQRLGLPAGARRRLRGTPRFRALVSPSPPSSPTQVRSSQKTHSFPASSSKASSYSSGSMLSGSTEYGARGSSTRSLRTHTRVSDESEDDGGWVEEGLALDPLDRYERKDRAGPGSDDGKSSSRSVEETEEDEDEAGEEDDEDEAGEEEDDESGEEEHDDEAGEEEDDEAGEEGDDDEAGEEEDEDETGEEEPEEKVLEKSSGRVVRFADGVEDTLHHVEDGDREVHEARDDGEAEGNVGRTEDVETGGFLGFDLRASSVLGRVMAQQSERLGFRNDPLRAHILQRESPLSSSRGGESSRRGDMAGLQAYASEYEENSEDEYDVDDEMEEEGSKVPVVLWARYLRSLPADFFTSAEARMERASNGANAQEERTQEGGGRCLNRSGGGMFDGRRRRCQPYASLAICQEPENCPDLRYAYEQLYQIQIERGGKKEGYQQFRAVAGQLGRFAVATEVVEAEAFAHPGGLLQLCKSVNLIRAFVGGFQANAQASTVYAKATLLCRLCRMAKQHFGKIPGTNTASTLAHIDETANLLGAFCRVEKATSRRQTAVLRDENRRGHNFIGASDWHMLQESISDDMNAVSAGLWELSERLDRGIHKHMDRNHGFVQKYALLLTVYVLLSGPGQRPQAYCSLEHPKERVLKEWERELESEHQQRAEGEDERGKSEGAAVKLYPGKEKTPRGTFHPGILFPDEARAFFMQYAHIVRPAIIRHASRRQGGGQRHRVMEDASLAHRSFLVHSEYGVELTVGNLRSTLRSYIMGVRGLQEDLSLVSVMTVRASFASLMFRSFREGSFEGRTTDEFLSELSEIMNTSPDMLRTTYIATNGQEFDEAARSFMRAARELPASGAQIGGVREIRS